MASAIVLGMEQVQSGFFGAGFSVRVHVTEGELVIVIHQDRKGAPPHERVSV